MKPAPFQYHAPTTVAETLDLLAQYANDDGRVLAGGQSLVPTMAFRLARPDQDDMLPPPCPRPSDNRFDERRTCAS